MPLPVREPGLAFICCMCVHMAEAHDKGLEDCGIAECGGPLLGRLFPRYKGPLKGNLKLYCFRCGALSDTLMEIEGSEDQGQLGFCKRCEHDIEENNS